MWLRPEWRQRLLGADVVVEAAPGDAPFFACQPYGTTPDGRNAAAGVPTWPDNSFARTMDSVWAAVNAACEAAIAGGAAATATTAQGTVDAPHAAGGDARLWYYIWHGQYAEGRRTTIIQTSGPSLALADGRLSRPSVYWRVDADSSRGPCGVYWHSVDLHLGPPYFYHVSAAPKPCLGPRS